MAFLREKHKIKIRVFMEVMGWPAEKLNEHLKEIVNVLRDKLNWKISREEYAEPIPAIEDNEQKEELTEEQQKRKNDNDLKKLAAGEVDPNAITEKPKSKMYRTHVEFEAEFNDVMQLFSFALAHGPSVIEILEPSELFLSASELQDILSDMVSKAQTMDKEIKILAAQNKKMGDFLTMLEKKGIIKKEPLNDEQGSN